MLEVNKETFQTEVLEAQGYVLVDYWNEGCANCLALMPAIEELAGQYQHLVKFTKLNTSKARKLAISQKVLGLPTISLYKDGQKIAEVTKDQATKANIDAMLQGFIK